MLLKSSLQRPGRGWRGVIAVVKVQPGCHQSTRYDDRRTDTTEDCFLDVWSKAMEKTRERRELQRGLASWTGALHKGHLTAPKRSIHSPFSRAWLGPELTSVWGLHHKA